MAEIFQNYEINPKPWWERVWRVVTGSLALHLILVACVLYIPGLREAFNIASVFSGAQYVEEDYDKTIIGSRATMINPNDLFEYPPGYFAGQGQVAQAEMPPVVVPTPAPVAPPPPQLTPKVVPTPVPEPSVAASPQATPAEDLTAALDDEMTKEERDKQLDEIAAKNKIERPNEAVINKKPLKDWLAKTKEAKDRKEFDVSGPIEMTIEAELGPDGKLVKAEKTIIKGDPKLEAVVTEFVAALSDSRALSFLKDVKHIRLYVSLTEKDVTVKVASEVESPARASEIAKGYSLLLIGGRIAKKGQTEEVIYKNTKVSSNGKEVTVDFTMPRKEATEILAKLPTS